MNTESLLADSRRYRDRTADSPAVRARVQAELHREFLLEQAEKLAGYLERGGSVRRWLRSKDFTAAERRVIIEHLRRLAPDLTWKAR